MLGFDVLDSSLTLLIFFRGEVTNLLKLPCYFF